MKKLSVIMVCVGLLIGLSGCGEDGAKDPVAPNLLDERQLQDGVRRLSEDTRGSDIDSLQYPPGTTVIVAIGDSITYGQGSTVGGYPALLQQKLVADGYNVVVVNEGIPGERSPSTDARFLQVIAGADVALIMIGTNDIINPAGCPNPYDCATSQHIDSLLDHALISKTVPIVSTLPPANPNSDYSWANFWIQSLNNQIYASAAQRDIVVVDNYNAILANGGTALYVDRLHFSDQGYGVIAEQWYRAIIENEILESVQ